MVENPPVYLVRDVFQTNNIESEAYRIRKKLIQSRKTDRNNGFTGDSSGEH